MAHQKKDLITNNMIRLASIHCDFLLAVKAETESTNNHSKDVENQLFMEANWYFNDIFDCFGGDSSFNAVFKAIQVGGSECSMKNLPPECTDVDIFFIVACTQFSAMHKDFKKSRTLAGTNMARLNDFPHLPNNFEVQFETGLKVARDGLSGVYLDGKKSVAEELLDRALSAIDPLDRVEKKTVSALRQRMFTFQSSRVEMEDAYAYVIEVMVKMDLVYGLHWLDGSTTSTFKKAVEESVVKCLAKLKTLEAYTNASVPVSNFISNNNVIPIYDNEKTDSTKPLKKSKFTLHMLKDSIYLWSGCFVLQRTLGTQMTEIFHGGGDKQHDLLDYEVKSIFTESLKRIAHFGH